MADVTSAVRDPRSTPVGQVVDLAHERAAVVEVVQLWQRPARVHLTITPGADSDEEGWVFTPDQARRVGRQLLDGASAADHAADMAEVFGDLPPG